MQNLEKTLDAAILTKTAVHSNVHDIITALSKGNYKVFFCNIKQVNTGKASFFECCCTLLARLHCNLMLV